MIAIEVLHSLNCSALLDAAEYFAPGNYLPPFRELHVVSLLDQTVPWPDVLFRRAMAVCTDSRQLKVCSGGR